jgi:CO/xanthine dehydrogenase Mo-binding subunit
MEEIQTRDGLITNASFTDYLIPTALDMPVVETELVEDPEPDAPYGVKGVGEPPTIVSTAAVVSALRAASGRELTRVPVRPDDLAGLRGDGRLAADDDGYRREDQQRAEDDA